MNRSADIVFPREQVACFVDGCLWHACPEHGERRSTPRRGDAGGGDQPVEADAGHPRVPLRATRSTRPLPWGQIDASMSPDVERARKELDELERELETLSSPEQQGFGTWRHRMYAVIADVVGAKSAVAIRFSGLPWTPRVTLTSTAPLRKAKEEASEIIRTLRWELDRRAPAPNPIDDSAIDPELWSHVRVLVEAQEWDKVALNASVFLEDKLRRWAQVPASVKGSTDVFKMALAQGKFRLGGQESEQQGWQQLATGFAMALRNRSGHRIDPRGDSKRYAVGVLGLASLLLTEIRYVYGDPPKLP